MNKSKLKTYAPQARKDFIAAVTARANLLGLSEAGGKLEVAPGERKGDIAIIAGREWPAKVYEQRERLIKHIQTAGFSQTMEAVAYTWFNRFAALRYMEIHDYLDHGHRVLSNRAGGMPEILNHATELELPGYNKARAVELKLAGNKDGELYKMLLVAQCNALSRAMPFLFERIDDETELLLPDNLLRTDSIVAKLVEAIPEEDWQEVEIIGWLYQFYISEKKDDVIGKVVKSEDIPAATQLFTPNWIVQYLVQNSVGRLWLMANPASTLKSQWPYYIEPAEQTPEVQAQLDALIQTRIQEDSPRPQAGEGLGERAVGATLNPETLTVLDPACGSGHILVVGYDVLKAIYLERGYQLRAIPRLILEKNLYGLDIDDRAAQLAGFALLMKARADDRRLFDNPPKLNVLALHESKGLDANEIARVLLPSPSGRGAGGEGAELVEAQSIRQLIDTFAHAKTFGTLIQIPQELNSQLPTLAEKLQQAIHNGDLYAQAVAQDLIPFVQQALVLGMQFDAVVANPPYMGGKGMNAVLREFARSEFPDSKSDLFAMFIERGFIWCKTSGFNSMVTMQSWMFLSSFGVMREKLLSLRQISSLVQIGYNSFPEMNSKVAQACAFVMSSMHSAGHRSKYVDLNSSDQSANKGELFLAYDAKLEYVICQDAFKKIPGSPVAYWVSEKIFACFEASQRIADLAETKSGMSTTDNLQFLRYWQEVSWGCVGLDFENARMAEESVRKWFPYSKGGEYRKWYGNQEYVVNWQEDGRDIRACIASDPAKQVGGRIVNEDFYFKPGIGWSDLTSGRLSARVQNKGFLFDSVNPVAFPHREEDAPWLLALLNSDFANYLSKILNPTLHFTPGNARELPVPNKAKIPNRLLVLSEQCVSIARADWDNFESSWNFIATPILRPVLKSASLEASWRNWEYHCLDAIRQMQALETENNRIFIEAYDLQERLQPEVPEEQITLTRADHEKDCQRLISYAIGCMMGRYSLDEPGLIYAHAANVGFDVARYQTFPADADGIVPLTDELWFEDDAANRIREFLLAGWGAETLEENLAWLAESLGKKGNETPIETIRRYLSGSFYKDHLQTYKKRPIYWLFSSGKQGAFQALVYLHRYHEGTLARMRSEYVVPLTGKIQSRIEMLTKDAAAATSTAARNKLNKEIEGLRKKHVELLSYDEKLRHYADMRIKLDLDDGVKVNYGKFGDLLAEVKAVTGGASDD